MSKDIHRDTCVFAVTIPTPGHLIFTINLKNPEKNGEILDGRESEAIKRNLDEIY